MTLQEKKLKLEQAVELSETSPQQALAEFSSLLNETDINDLFILSKIGFPIRKLGGGRLYLEKINSLDFQNVKSNQYIVSPYLWCVYDTQIKDYKYDENSYDNFIKWAEVIVSNSQQLADCFMNPYVITIFKVIEITKKKATASDYQILKWLEKLNADILPAESNLSVKVRELDVEMAPLKEKYFQLKSRSQEKICKYEECIETCKTALATFTKFHYQYGFWFQSRQLFCECMLDPSDKNINNYKDIAEKKKFWYMYHKLGNVFLSLKKTQDALTFYFKALLSDKIDPEKMINLFSDIGLLLSRDESKAEPFIHCAVYYRNQYGWGIPEEIKLLAHKLGINEATQPNLSLLIQIAQSYLKSLNVVKEGKVSTCNDDKKFGYIGYEGNKCIHFFFSAYKGGKPRKDDIVYFEAGPTTEKGTTALNIYKKG